MNDIFKDMKVIELASVLAGPSVGQFFAELGAKVIKVENSRTNGDATRKWKLPQEDENLDICAYFLSVNWGKEHLFLNITEDDEYAQLLELLKVADVVITSYKPGDAEKLKVDYERLREINPKLVYGSITGYGAEDKRAGYDAILQAESGFMYMNGQPDSLPTKMPVALIDVLTGHQLKEGLLLALLKREQTGEGSLVEVSLFESGITSLANQALNWLHAGHVPERMGSEHPNISPYGTVFYSKDEKPIVLAIGTDRQFSGLCAALGIPEMAEDEKFSKNQMRVMNNDELNEKLKTGISKWNREELINRLDNLNIPAGAVNTMKDLFKIPMAQEMVLDNKGLPGLKQVAFKLN